MPDAGLFCGVHDLPCRMQSRLAKLVTRFPWLIIATFVAITAFFTAQLSRVTIDTEMKRQLPAHLETSVNLEKIESLFGGTDMVMIILVADDVLGESTLTRLQTLSREFSSIREFDRVLGLFSATGIRVDEGEMLVEPVVAGIPTTRIQREKLRNRIRDNALVYGNLVSKDFKHTALIGFLKLEASDEVVIQKVNDVVASAPGADPVYVGGMPLTRVNLAKDIRNDMSRFLPVGLMVMFGFLFICFRQPRGVLLPFLMTVMAVIFAMGLIPLLGWKVHTVTVLLPVILLAVANDYGIHVLARYQEDNTPGSPLAPAQLAESGIAALTRPILATGVTTMAGLLCLLSHVIIPAEQLGILAAAGVAFAVLGSLLFIPAVLSLLPRSRPVLGPGLPAGGSRTCLDRLLCWIASRVPRRPKAILVTCVVAALGIGSGAHLIVLDTNPLSFYHKEEPVWQSTHLLNAHLGGWAGVSAVAQGDLMDPGMLREIDGLEQHLKKHELVGATSSISGIVRMMNRAAHGNDPTYDKIPESNEAIERYLLRLAGYADADELNKLVGPYYEHTQLIARVTESSTRGVIEIVDYIRAYLVDRPGSPFILVGGLVDVMADMVVHVVRGQLLSIMLSVLIVGCLVGLLMRSFGAAVLSMFPLTLGLLLLFGAMGYFGIELNLITAMLSSIMIGVGVDYTIHFLWRYRDERSLGAEPPEAVRRTLTTVGRGIVFNALSVLVGFAVLTLSAFFPVRFFGLLVLISISACLVGALVVLPAIVTVFKPKFLEPART